MHERRVPVIQATQDEGTDTVNQLLDNLMKATDRQRKPIPTT